MPTHRQCFTVGCNHMTDQNQEEIRIFEAFIRLNLGEEITRWTNQESQTS